MISSRVLSQEEGKNKRKRIKAFDEKGRRADKQKSNENKQNFLNTRQKKTLRPRYSPSVGETQPLTTDFTRGGD